MSERAKHLFEFPAYAIAKAAAAEAAYHETRIKFWQVELKAAMDRVRETAKLEVVEQQVTGGVQLNISIDYGDQVAYTRMNESRRKLDSHRALAERFRSDEKVYSSQGGRVYQLDADDVHHFRLSGKPREE